MMRSTMGYRLYTNSTRFHHFGGFAEFFIGECSALPSNLWPFWSVEDRDVHQNPRADVDSARYSTVTRTSRWATTTSRAHRHRGHLKLRNFLTAGSGGRIDFSFQYVVRKVLIMIIGALFFLACIMYPFHGIGMLFCYFVFFADFSQNTSEAATSLMLNVED